MKHRTVYSRLLSMLLCLTLLLGAFPAGLQTAAAAETGCSHSSLVWTELSGSVAGSTLKDGGNFRLTADTHLTGVIKAGSGAKLHIDLNGHTLTAADTLMELTSAEATICDSSAAGTGKVDGQGKNTRFLYLVSGSVLNIYGGTLTGIHGTEAGKGMITSNASTNTIHLYGGTVTGNKNLNGGAVWLNAGTLNIYGGAISGNEASAKGGAVFVQSGTVNVTGGVISGNACPGGYGGAFNMQGGTINLAGGTVENNTAAHGGAVVQINMGSLTMTGGSFLMTGGFLTDNHRAVYAKEAASVTITEGTVSGNEAEQGAALLAEYAKVQISGGSFMNNRSETAIVEVSDGTVTLSGGAFSDNEGAAMLFASDSETTVTGGTVRGNEGKALQLQGGFAVVSGKAVLEDGGVSLSDGGSMTIQKLSMGASIYAPAETEGLTVAQADTILTTELEELQIRKIHRSYGLEASGRHAFQPALR